MVKCKNCGKEFSTQRWITTGAYRHGNINTTCENCNVKMEVYIPSILWYSIVLIMPLLLILALVNYVTIYDNKIVFFGVIIVLFLWPIMLSKLLFILYGKVKYS
jgi:uncharacterized protein (DUF983 family)